MADVELVIKIPEEIYKNINNHIGMAYAVEDYLHEVEWAIKNGTLIDKYEPCVTMSKAFANSVAYVKILKDENEELKNKINNIIAEIEHTGAYELEIHGRTDFLSGISYCLNTFDKNGLTVNKTNKENREKPNQTLKTCKNCGYPYKVAGKCYSCENYSQWISIDADKGD